jgi:hypothetical protein
MPSCPLARERGWHHPYFNVTINNVGIVTGNERKRGIEMLRITAENWMKSVLGLNIVIENTSHTLQRRLGFQSGQHELFQSPETPDDSNTLISNM